MVFTTNDALTNMQEARVYFKRHIGKMAEAGWDFKPFPHVNSIRQILTHMIATNRAVSVMLSGEGFDMARHVERHKEAWAEIENVPSVQILALLDKTGEEIAASVGENYPDASFNTLVTLWGAESKLGVQLVGLSQEMAYHTGQVSLLRQAFDPSWDYFGEVFGM